MKHSSTARPQDWAEGRRLRAFDLAQQGWKQKDIAAALGVTPGAVSQWLKRARDGGGRAALRSKSHPGRKPKLSIAQRHQLPALLARGAEAFGFLGAVWTTKRIATVIKETFGVSYHPAHISRLMRQRRQSRHLPEIRATQRDPTAVEGWYTKRWPALKKGARRRADHCLGRRVGILLVASTGPDVCADRPNAGVAGAAHTESSVDDRGITSAGRLLLQRHGTSIRGRGVVRFLHHLLRHIPGKLLVVWDGASIHRCKVVQAFLAAGAAARLWLEPLPSYAPDLNPAEGIWRYLKRAELRNICCRTLNELERELCLAIARLRHKRTVIQACIIHSGYEL